MVENCWLTAWAKKRSKKSIILIEDNLKDWKTEMPKSEHAEFMVDQNWVLQVPDPQNPRMQLLRLTDKF